VLPAKRFPDRKVSLETKAGPAVEAAPPAREEALDESEDPKLEISEQETGEPNRLLALTENAAPTLKSLAVETPLPTCSGLNSEVAPAI
jgi:hypothetical protein